MREDKATCIYSVLKSAILSCIRYFYSFCVYSYSIVIPSRLFVFFQRHFLTKYGGEEVVFQCNDE